jgi:glycosyltransferase involved in cell wall biosynthesis
LHYLDPEDTGLNHVRQFAEAARGLGHRVDVHGLNLATAAALERDGRRRERRPALRRHLGRYLREPKQLIRNASYLRSELGLLRASRPDVLLVRHARMVISGVVAGRRLGLPLVIEANAPVAESRLYDDGYVHLLRVAEWLEAWGLRRGDAITVVSSALKHYLVDRWGLPAAKLTVVPNGADLKRFHPDVARDPQLPEAFQREVVVGFVGSFQKFHGSALIARMVTEVGKARPSVRFLFVGDGPEAEKVRRETSELGDRVLFTGAVPHARVPGLVAALDVGVLPETAFYCSPLKIVEWMASGKAVVAPAHEPLEELIDQGVHGLLFPPRDLAAMVEAVLQLVDRPESRTRMGQEAARRARTSLSWKANASRVIEACRGAQNLHSGRRRGKPAG